MVSLTCNNHATLLLYRLRDDIRQEGAIHNIKITYNEVQMFLVLFSDWFTEVVVEILHFGNVYLFTTNSAENMPPHIPTPTVLHWDPGSKDRLTDSLVAI